MISRFEPTSNIIGILPLGLLHNLLGVLLGFLRCDWMTVSTYTVMVGLYEGTWVVQISLVAGYHIGWVLPFGLFKIGSIKSVIEDLLGVLLGLF